MSTIRLIRRLPCGGSLVSQWVNSCSGRFGVRHLCAKAYLSMFQTVRFPPSKMEFQNILQTVEDCPISSADCENLHRLVESQQGGGSFWPNLLKTSTELDHTVLTQSVVDFILSDPHRHNHATIVCALGCLVTEKRFDDFRALYTMLRSRLSPIELTVLASSLVGLLARTPEWEQGFDLLPLVERTIGQGLLRKLCDGAVTYSSLSAVFPVLEQLVKINSPPTAEFFDIFFQRLLEPRVSVDADEHVNRLLSLLEQTNWAVPDNAARLICEWFNKKPDWQAQLDVRLHKTECPVCHTKLPVFELTADSVKSLADKFYDRMFKGTCTDDVYLTTTPNELKTLDRFLAEQVAPFDCVVDFLNVVHLFRLPFEPQRVGSTMCEILLKLSRSFNLHRFCLVGKGNKVIRNAAFLSAMRNLGNQAGLSIFTFITQRSSVDDAFMIYMSLWSGPQCYLVSNDEFKQHRYTVGFDMSPQLSRWQSVRQIALQPGSSKLCVDPTKCNTKVHGDMLSGWHIPYDDNAPRRSYVPPNLWLCAMRKPSNETN